MISAPGGFRSLPRRLLWAANEKDKGRVCIKLAPTSVRRPALSLASLSSVHLPMKRTSMINTSMTITMADATAPMCQAGWSENSGVTTINIIKMSSCPSNLMARLLQKLGGHELAGLSTMMNCTSARMSSISPAPPMASTPTSMAIAPTTPSITASTDWYTSPAVIKRDCPDPLPPGEGGVRGSRCDSYFFTPVTTFLFGRM